MTPARKIEVLVPVVRLRERRLDLARREAALAREALLDAEAERARCEAVLAYLAQEITRVDAWFAERLDSAAVQAGLARREALVAARVAGLRERDAAESALEAARVVLAEAVAAAQRAEGRRDAMRDQLSGARSRRRVEREEREQLDLEDLTRRPAW
jgi:hypothetical protein